MSSFVKAEFSPDHIKNVLYTRVVNKVFDYEGVIFGGYVRDKIISNHYNHEYNNAHSNIWENKKFWNKQYHPETVGRLLTPNDLDICVSDNLSAKGLIEDIKNMIYEDFDRGNVIISSHYTTDSGNKYFKLAVSSVTKLEFAITVGKIPYMCPGHTINVSFDIVVRHNYLIQPPFGNLDFLCNMFIMSKSGISISGNTGTKIDNMSIIDKKKVELKVMTDMIEFKTEFCLNVKKFDTDFNYNISVCDRLEKMAMKVPSWTIGNLPINIEGSFAISCEKNKDMCCICMSGFKKSNGNISIPIPCSAKTGSVNGSKMHSACLFKYLKNQLLEETIANRYTPDSNIEKFLFKCPMRNLFCFDEYGDKINEIVKAYIT
jgi:hypothetical protein